MPTASASAQTQFALGGWGTRRYGSFAGKATITAPTVPGIEFTIGIRTSDFTLPESRLHFDFSPARLHYDFPEED